MAGRNRGIHAGGGDAGPTGFARIAVMRAAKRGHVRGFSRQGTNPAGAPEVKAERMRTRAPPPWLRLEFLFLLAPFQESDSHLIAVDPGELAAPICQPSGRKYEEEFLQMKTFNGALDRKFRAGIGHIFHDAGPSPSAVDRHHVGGISPFKYDPLRLPLFHGLIVKLQKC